MIEQRRFTMVALHPVLCAGKFLGHVRRVFYRSKDLIEDLEVLWGEEGPWGAEDQWSPNTRLGKKFFRLCKEELFAEAESRRVLNWVLSSFADLRDPTVRLIRDDFLEGEVPLRMLLSGGSRSQWPRRRPLHDSDLCVGAFAEIGCLDDGGLRPMGGYGWACQLEDVGDGASEAQRTKPLGEIACLEPGQV